MKKIALASIGGTISMQVSNNGGITPQIGAKDFISAIPEIKKIAQISTHNLFSIASGHITFQNLLEAYNWAKNAAKDSQGIIITQGTDTLEESAFFLSLLWNEPIPLILTGAMRSSDELGYDGLNNIYNAITLIVNYPSSLNTGVMVVMNNTIHHPLWMQKKHSLALETFDSMHQELGIIFENKVEFFRPLSPLPKFPNLQTLHKKVFCYEHSLDDEKEILEWAGEKYDGIVIAGYGAGHTNLQTRDTIIKIAKTKPVIMCARTYAGPSAISTYGYLGSEIDLQKEGVVMSKWLQPKKARILLAILLSQNLGIKDFINFRDFITIK